MGIYIELPKDWAKYEIIVTDFHDNELEAKVTDLDLVRCGECKYSKIYALQSDTPMSRWCHKGHFPKDVTDGYYCGDGERRADE